MSDTLKISGPIKVGSSSADPSGAQEGYIYYNTTSGKFKMYQSGAFKEIVDEDVISNLTASGVAYARADVNKKNVDAASDDVESAITDLDDAIGALASSPTNYTPTDATIVADHLSAIDSALAGTTPDASVVTYTPAVATDWNGDVDPGDVDNALDQLAERVDDNEISISTNTSNISTNTTDVSNLQSALGSSTANMGTFTGNVLTDSTTAKANLQELSDYAESTRSLVNNFEWQDSALDYITDNTVAPPTEVSGDRYVLSHDGGAPNAAWDGASAGDIVEFDGTNWVATTPTTGMFISVDDETNGIYQWGGSSWSLKSFESTTASSGLTKVGFDIQIASAGVTDAKVATGIDAAKLADGSVSNTEFQYINSLTSNAQTQIDAKLSNVVEDTTPQLGGNLDTNGNDIEDASNDIVIAGQNSVKRAKQASKSSFIEEEYIHSISLSGSQTDTVMSDFTFAHATIEGLEICYKLKEATSNDIKIGTIRVVTNGTNVVLNDMGTETADTGITFSAAINGANVEVRYSSGTNGGTLRADVKKFLA